MCVCVCVCCQDFNREKIGYLITLEDGWLICDFTFFSTVFQSDQDDGRMKMKGCVQWNPFMVEKISPRAGLELGSARSVGQRLTH